MRLWRCLPENIVLRLIKKQSLCYQQIERRRYFDILTVAGYQPDRYSGSLNNRSVIREKRCERLFVCFQQNITAKNLRCLYSYITATVYRMRTVFIGFTQRVDHRHNRNSSTAFFCLIKTGTGLLRERQTDGHRHVPRSRLFHFVRMHFQFLPKGIVIRSERNETRVSPPFAIR